MGQSSRITRRKDELEQDIQGPQYQDTQSNNTLTDRTFGTQSLADSQSFSDTSSYMQIGGHRKIEKKHGKKKIVT